MSPNHDNIGRRLSIRLLIGILLNTFTGSIVTNIYGQIYVRHMRKQVSRTTFVDSNSKYQRLLKKHLKMRTELGGKTRKIEVLKQVIEERDLRIEELETIVNEKDSKIKKLERKLAYFDNPNTPSSNKQPGNKGKKREPNNSTKKRGAQPNHKGTTNKPQPTIKALHIPTKCDNCGSVNLNLTKCNTRNITNTEITVTTAKHEFYEGQCDGCGACTEPPDRPTSLQWIVVDGDMQEPSEAALSFPFIAPDIHSVSMPANVVRCVSQKLPKRGEYGLGAVLLTVLNFMDRLPFKLNSRALRRWGVEMSSGTVHNIMDNTGMNLAAPTADIRLRIRGAYVLHVDETSISLNGTKVWVWIFHNPETGDTYIVIRPSRGKDVIEEVLGKNWKGRIVCDGWVAYKQYRKQRCWAHIITAIRHAVDRNPQCAEAQEVLDALVEIYRIGCQVKGSAKERRRVRALLDKRVRRLVLKYGDVPEIKSFITKLSNARPNLFHFVTDPRIPPTNNAAERGLREIVVHRKVRGSIRAETTMTWMGNLFSCISTWMQRKMDISSELVKYI